MDSPMSARTRHEDDQSVIPVVMMRGGTSKGVFVRDHDLPAPGPARDMALLDLMGSPDPMQLDGLGGTHVNTSKVMIIQAGEAAGTDVEYTAVQVGTDVAIVDYSGNCGNLSAAVGAYAVDEGLVPVTEPVTVVRMLNHNSHARILAHVPVHGGVAAYEGDYKVDGVPGTGAPIVLEFLDPAGSVFGRLLPTGNLQDRIETSRGPFSVSIVDVSHPTVFVRASDLGLTGDEPADELNADSALLSLFEEIRGGAAVLLKVAERADAAAMRSPVVPRMAIVSPPPPGSDTIQVTGRTVAMGRVIHSYALTVAICTAAACRIDGTIPHALASPSRDDEIRIAHPSGTISASIKLDTAAETPTVISAAIVRTARRLLKGSAFLKQPSPAVARHTAPVTVSE
jgi:2-methylaconitate cis-trans-isomerase PrpF